VTELQQQSTGATMREPSGASGDPTPGEGRVDAVLAALGELDRLPVAEHVAILEAVHAELRDALDGREHSGHESPGGTTGSTGGRPATSGGELAGRPDSRG
jgi:hypothetical protein